MTPGWSFGLLALLAIGVFLAYVIRHESPSAQGRRKRTAERDVEYAERMVARRANNTINADLSSAGKAVR